MNEHRRNLTIGVLSQRSGVKVETIRYYEREGLIPEPPRSEGGHRQYSDDHLRRLVFIRRSRELGFRLEEVRTLLGLVNRGYSCGQVKTLTLQHLTSIRRKITDLQKLEKTLAEVSSRCEGGAVPECPIIDALFEG